MAEQTFADFITRDRERLHAEREQISKQEHELEGKLADINRELSAINAYEAAKSGKAPAAARQPRGARARPQARSGSKREALMEVIKANASGLTRGEILERMGLKGDRRDVGVERADRVDQERPGHPQRWAVHRRLSILRGGELVVLASWLRSDTQARANKAVLAG